MDPALRPSPVLLARLTVVPLVAGALVLPSPATAAGPAAPRPVAGAAAEITPDPADFEPGAYVVVLKDQPAASAVAPGRARQAQRYADRLASTQRSVADDAGVTPLASYTLATNGFGADLTSRQAADLAADPRVAQVVPDELLKIADTSTSTGYLGLEGSDGVWAGLGNGGGPQQAGRGTVVGVIDTGIAPENPSFAGNPLGTTDGAAPFRRGQDIVFHKSDGTDFVGTCVTGVQFDAADCSTKVVGARYFVEGFGVDNIGGPSVGEYLSPRDGDSHGSHTASTAAGDPDVATGAARISGVTPGARIAAYKACWSGPVATSTDDDGCATIDLLGAIDAAVADGVDVINFSIGGGAASTTNSLTDQAFRHAAAAGIFVAAAGGNAGPDVSTLDNASPWITTVAASTIPAPEGTVELGDGTGLLGATISVPTAGVTGRLVLAADVAATGAATPELCGPGVLDPAKVAGTIVVCDRGEVARLDKSAEVERAGGIGMVLVNPTASSTDLDAHAVPTVHLDADSYDALHAYAATPGATATLLPGNLTDLPSVPTPQVAGFSSRGPVEADGSDLVKPDVAAPGVNILAAYSNGEGEDPRWGYLSGTSMASPHVAGLAALYLGEHPLATPAEIKSALMTSTTDTVDADGAALPDPFAQGNGQVRPTSYLDPGLLYLNDTDDWDAYLAAIGESPDAAGAEAVDPSDLNLASVGIGGLAGVQTVTRTVTATRAGTWTAAVTGVPGVDVTVSPSTLTLAAGATATYEITFERTNAFLGDFTTGQLTWTDGSGGTVRSALAVRPVAFDAPTEVAGTGTDGSVELVPHVGEDADVELRTEGLARGQRVDDTATVGETATYAVTVPDSASFARFDLDAVDDTADLDLAVYRRNPRTGGTSIIDASATGSADERVDLGFVQGGTYFLVVDAYAAGASGSTALDFALTSYVVTPDAALGGFVTDPTLIEGHVGDTPVITASWTGLEPGAYLGLVRYGDTGISTIVTVDAGPEVPAAPGTATLAVEPDATEWVANGDRLRVAATGLTPGASYAVALDDGPTVRTGKASTRGTVDWGVVLADDVTPGLHDVHLAGPGADLSAEIRVSPVALVEGFGFASTGFDGTAYARLDLSFRGHGTVRFHLEDATTGAVYLDEEQEVQDVPVLPSTSTQSRDVPVQPGELLATATVVLPDGTDGPTYTFDPFVAEGAEPGSITFARNAADPAAVDVTITNNTFTTFNPMVRYYGCDGRQVVANGYLAYDTTTQTWDLSGFTRVEVLDDKSGDVLAAYDNAGADRCATDRIAVYQDFWGTYSVGDRTSDRPIDLDVSFRYPARSAGFQLLIGEGKRNVDEDFFYEAIPVEEVTVKGPVVTRSVTVPAGVTTFSQAYFEGYIDPPGIHYQGTQWIDAPALTLADLTPVTPVRPGTPRIRGRHDVGSTLTAVPGAWGPNGVALRYQWLRAGQPIKGATRASYRLVRADAGRRVAVRVTGALAGTPAVTRTAPAVAVTRLLTAKRPRIDGRLVVGRTVRALTPGWKPGAIRFTYRWLRDGRPIAGATGKRYDVRRADRGHRIVVVVTGHKAGYRAEERRAGRLAR